MRGLRALGFCVGIEHARFMATRFTEADVPAVAIWGDSPRDERRSALRDLDTGRVRVVFTVDLLNEGVDVPTVDTLLLLRPTDSPTLFLGSSSISVGHAVCWRPGRGGQWPPRSSRQRAMRLSVERNP